MARVSNALLNNIFHRFLKAHRKPESTGYDVTGWFLHHDDNGVTVGAREHGRHGAVTVLYPSCKPSELVERMKFAIAALEAD